MDMIPLIAKCPEACRQTVCIPIFDHETIPEGLFALLESYCSDPECDCRRVFLNVIDKYDPKKILATIGFGWEDVEFYEKWLGDKNMKYLAKEMKGPILEPGGVQTKYSNDFLDIFKERILTEESIEIWKDHYEIFKAECKKGSYSEKQPTFSKKRKIGRNEPCPCGSGKKYKRCCLED